MPHTPLFAHLRHGEGRVQRVLAGPHVEERWLLVIVAAAVYVPAIVLGVRLSEHSPSRLADALQPLAEATLVKPDRAIAGHAGAAFMLVQIIRDLKAIDGCGEDGGDEGEGLRFSPIGAQGLAGTWTHAGRRWH